MTYNFDDVKDTKLNINEFLTLLKLYLEYSNKDDIEFEPRDKDYFVLQKKGMIKIIKNDNELSFSIRGLGKETIERVMNFQKVKSKNNSSMSNLFDEFWKLFPSTDKHSIYPKTRALKSNRIGCKNKYFSYLKNGTKHEDIIKALRYEINERKNNSGRDNKLSFMKNSNTWLNQREFDIILETMQDSDNNDSDWTSNTV